MEGNLVELLTASRAADNVLIVAKASDLQDFAREHAALILKQEREQKAKEKPVIRKPLTSKETCALLNITMPTLTKYRRKRLFKGHVLDGKVYYFENEIIEALQNRK